MYCLLCVSGENVLIIVCFRPGENVLFTVCFRWSSGEVLYRCRGQTGVTAPTQQYHVFCLLYFSAESALFTVCFR